MQVMRDHLRQFSTKTASEVTKFPAAWHNTESDPRYGWLGLARYWALFSRTPIEKGV